MQFSRANIYAVITAVLLTGGLFLPATAFSEQTTDYGALDLRVVDADTEQPVTDVLVLIEGEADDFFTDDEGRLKLDGLFPREAFVTFDHVEYDPKNAMVEIEAGKKTEFDIQLPPLGGATASAPESESVVVTTTGRKAGIGEVYRPTTSITGDELQRHRRSTVPSTLNAIPGIDVQYNGPGASSPTIRGMPGDRVLMLEDGHGTGDISWTASDHGVMVEPLTAQRMEIIRGPAGLLFGSNALGGVSNVIREDVPLQPVEGLQGRLGSQLESVNRGASTGIVLRGPLGPLSFYGEATARRAGDTQTALGPLEQTQMNVLNMGVGMSAHPDWGIIGGAVRYYDNAYGVPGEFDGQLIPGGHPGGVDIEVTRMSARLLAEYQRPLEIFDGVELRSNVTQYLHDEIEGVIGDQEVVGASFEQLSTDSRLLARHDLLGDPADGWAAEGALGFSARTRDLSAGGVAPGTRSGLERDLGVFAYEELFYHPFRLQAGLRFDYRHVAPRDFSPLRTRTDQRTIERDVTSRNFTALSGSLSTLWDFSDHWTLGAVFAHSFRNPTIEELYSDGPHLADFSYDIGNPDLPQERGLGTDLFIRGDHTLISLELAGYVNRIDDYIYYNPTGETVRSVREGERPRTIPVFEASGEDALFYGAEGRLEWMIHDDIWLDMSASYTLASRRDGGDPLPAIPPLSGRLEWRYDGDPFFGSVGANVSAPQNRVPRPVEVEGTITHPEQPTEGYSLMHAMVGFRHAGDTFFHTVMLQIENPGNVEWRDHMSRIKEVAPGPGRNIQLSYEAEF